MYESEKVGDLCKGEKLAFARREVIERPSQGWQDEMSASGAITVIVHRALEAEESGEEYMSGSEAGSDGEESDQAGLEGNPGPDEDGSGADEDGPLAGPSGRDKSRKSKKTAVAPVKQDSKWALHFSVAPAAGEGVEIGAPSAAERTGNVLGRQILRYRGAEWFQTIDLMLQEERMRRNRLKQNAGIIVGESAPEGSTKDTAICVEDSPAVAEQAAANHGRGGPIRGSNMLRVSFHEGGRNSPVTHMVEVPKCHNIANFKSTVKDALADEDIFGKEIRSSRLKWTYVQSEGDTCELDISPFTEASALESSSALHVYLMPRR